MKLKLFWKWMEENGDACGEDIIGNDGDHYYGKTPQMMIGYYLEYLFEQYGFSLANIPLGIQMRNEIMALHEYLESEIERFAK